MGWDGGVGASRPPGPPRVAALRAKWNAKKSHEVSDEVLDSYVGDYDFGAIGKMVVTRKGNHLAAKLGAQPALDIFPKSETEFFYGGINAQLEFGKDDDGKVRKVILRQGFVKLQARRVE